MNLTIFGATGNIGQRIVAEALNRGHEVAIARTQSLDKLEAKDGVTITEGTSRTSRASRTLWTAATPLSTP